MVQINNWKINAHTHTHTIPTGYSYLAYLRQNKHEVQ